MVKFLQGLDQAIRLSIIGVIVKIGNREFLRMIYVMGCPPFYA